MPRELTQRRFVAAAAAVRVFAGPPAIDADRFRADVDALIDQDPLPRT